MKPTSKPTFEQSQTFFLDNRKKTVVKAIEVAQKKLKNEDKTEYERFCSEIRRLNDCSNTTDEISAYIRRDSTLLSQDWIELNQSILDENNSSKEGPRKKAQDELNAMYPMRIVELLFPVLAVGAVIALGVFVAPGFFALMAFAMVSFIPAIVGSPSYNRLLNQLKLDHFTGEQTRGLVFAPEELNEKLGSKGDEIFSYGH